MTTNVYTQVTTTDRIRNFQQPRGSKQDHAFPTGKGVGVWSEVDTAPLGLAGPHNSGTGVSGPRRMCGR